MSKIIGIKRYSISGLEALLKSWGEPKYRAKQLFKWIYNKQVDDYCSMTDLPKSLQARLAASEPLVSPKVLKVSNSSDGSSKYLLGLSDGLCVEAVAIPDNNRLTVCFSTQVGCAMGCAFCATGTQGLTRSLWPGEIVDQLIVISKHLNSRVTNAVAMGEGEPFANYENVLDALRIMNNSDGLGIGARHITVSTCGLVKPIAKFSKEAEQFTLAVSLHSANESTRGKLMPIFAGQSLDELRNALIDYANVSGRRPSLEVTLMKGVNDTDLEVDALVHFARGLLCHINLITFNPPNNASKHIFPDKDSRLFIPTDARRSKQIAGILSRAGIECSIRRSRGQDIDAACGQLKASMNM